MRLSFGSAAVFVLAACSAPYADEIRQDDISSTDTTAINSIYWSDGDSGRIDGMKFRLANIDAPETGGVGAIGGAKCEAERVLGFEAKAFMVELTRNADLEVIKSYGPDRYEREVIDLAVNGQDITIAAIAEGHIKLWPHKGRRAQAPKPDWCGQH